MMLNNSTNINKTNTYLYHLNTTNTKKITTYDLGNPDLGTGEKKCGGIKSDNGILKTCLVDN